MIGDEYKHITELVKQKQINSKLELTKNKKTAKYKFSGNKLEDLINNPQELKNIVGFISDLQFSMYQKTNQIIPIELNLDLEKTRQIYEQHYNKTTQPMFQELHKLTNKQNPYFDLCFYTLAKYKQADYIGFPGFEFYQNEKFINRYIQTFSKELILKDVF